MSATYEPHAAPAGVYEVYKIAGRGCMFATCLIANIPSAKAGYAKGCLLQALDATSEADGLYINTGTLASCTFTAFDVNLAVMADLSALTASAVDLNTLDVQALAIGPGVGVTGGVGTIAKYSIHKSGSIIKTTILIDLTGLNGGGTGGDIIGTNGAGVAHFGQLAVAVCGTILGGRVSCLETPAGSNVDVDVWTADEATGVEDTAISALTNEQQLIDHGNWAAGEIAGMIIPPLADQYLYLTSGAATAATFTAGQFLLEFFGYV